MIEYKGYTAHITYEADDDVLVGSIEGLRDVIAFEGQAIGEMKRRMKEAIDGYLEYCAEQGIEPAKPYSGRFNLRMAPEIHRAVAEAAEARGESMNAFVVSALERAARGLGGTAAPKNRPAKKKSPRRRARTAR